jgi:hypothetical protein
MSRIKEMLYKNDINRFAISEYKSRITHYIQVTDALRNMKFKTDIRNYKKSVRMYEMFLNAQANIYAMIDFLYQANRGIINPDDKFYPYGKNSPYLSKSDYLRNTIMYCEELMRDAEDIQISTNTNIKHYNMLISDKVYHAIYAALPVTEFITVYDTAYVDKISETLNVLLNYGYVDDHSVVLHILYLKLIVGLYNDNQEYTHPYYDYVKNNIISKICTTSACPVDSDDHPGVYIELLKNYVSLL